MRHLLSKASSPVLERLARANTLCAFDFDGTLAPIVDDPLEAAMRTSTRELLGELCRLYPVAVLSGRARTDLAGKLNGAGVSSVIGNHGGETAEESGGTPGRVGLWKAILELRLPKDRGLWVEDKGLSLAVHYRRAIRKAEARNSIHAAVRGLEGLKIVGGKEVINLIESHAPTKGDALAAERDRLGCNAILYVGDDDNDEDAFGLEGDLVPVRVGRTSKSKARFYIPSQEQIDDLLRRMVDLRRTPRTQA